MEPVFLVMTNLPDEASATTLATALVEAGLAACVNILPGVQSVYLWEGRLEQEREVTLLIKTSGARYAELEVEIRARHPYQLPEIIAWPLPLGWPPYLQWIAAQTRKDMNV